MLRMGHPDFACSYKNNGWLEERAGNALADGDHLSLTLENLDQRSLREFRQIDLHAVAQARDGLLVGGDAGKLGQQRARMGQARGELPCACERFCLAKLNGLLDAEGAGGGAAQAGEVRSTTENLAKLVGNGTDVSTSRDTHMEGGEFPVDGDVTEAVLKALRGVEAIREVHVASLGERLQPVSVE